MENEIKTLTRRQLYDEIWQMSVAGVARKYNFTYGKLIEACKREDIPYPSSGYWTKKRMGKDVSGEIVALSGNESIEILLSSLRFSVSHINKQRREESKDEITDITATISAGNSFEDKSEGIKEKTTNVMDMVGLQNQDFLLFLNNDERERVLLCAQNIEIDKNIRLHKNLVQYKKNIENYRKKLKDVQNNSYYNKPQNEPEFFKEISDEGTVRAFAILNTLYKAIESLGGSVNDDLSVLIRQDIVRFKMKESQNQVKHELSKQEAQQLVKYNDDVKNGRLASKPRIRKYDKIYNGKLRIIIDGKRYIRDSSNEKLEDCLGAILIALYEKSEENRITREAGEAQRRKREEEERCREQKRRRKEQEILQIIELVNKSEDYRIASDIREYIKAIIDSGKEAPNSEWVQWANRKADWYDPTIAYNDEFLGIREHGKSKDEKEKNLYDSISARRGWSW